MTKITTFIAASALTVSASFAQPSTAEEAWNSLLTPNYAKSTAFGFVPNNPDLKNVLIYGDSISMGYTPTVREQLADIANVYRIHKNGGSSRFIVRITEELEATMRNSELSDRWDFKWDVIAFNVGLHDLKYVRDQRILDKENGRQVSSIAKYKEFLEDGILFLKERHPSATLVFVTTTPVPEGDPGRYAGDAAVYNQAALEVFAQYPEIVISDLYAFTKPNVAEWQLKPGDVHYKPEGRKAQGHQVAADLRKVLEQ